MAVGDMISSSVWGGKQYEITQEFGVPGFDPSLYPGGHGLPAGYHGGLDINVPKYTPIFALNPGRVDFAGFNNTFRPFPVFIKTDDNPDTQVDETGYTEIYGHLWSDNVSTGQRVKPGDKLGISGEETISQSTNQPDGTGPHLHFELYDPSDKAVNPTSWLKQQDKVPTTDTNGKPDDGTNGKNIPDSTDLPTSIPDLSSIIDLAKNVSSRTLIIAVGIVLLSVALVTLVRA